MSYVQRVEEQNFASVYTYKVKSISTTREDRYVENKPYYALRTLGAANPTYPGFSLAPYGGFELSSNAESLLKSRAYNNIIEAIRGDSASIGNAIGEWQSSYSMVATRATQLLQGLKAFKRGQIGKAADILAVPKDAVRRAHVQTRDSRGRLRNARGSVSKRHWAASLWLETYFGWLPAIGDIHSAMKVLEEPVRNLHHVKGKSTSQSDSIVADFRNSERTGDLYIGTTKKRANYYAKVEVTNQNLFLASRMGLVNPASIAWELTPFSFVVDWFVNVGQILDSFTDLAGITIHESGYTTKRTSDLTYRYFENMGNEVIGIGFQVNARTTEFRRSIEGIDRPPIAFQSPLGNWKRAVTQIALLNSYIKLR